MIMLLLLLMGVWWSMVPINLTLMLSAGKSEKTKTRHRMIDNTNFF